MLRLIEQWSEHDSRKHLKFSSRGSENEGHLYYVVVFVFNGKLSKTILRKLSI